LSPDVVNHSLTVAARLEWRDHDKDKRITQLRKGILELAVMGVLYHERHYGYSLVRVLSESGSISLKQLRMVPAGKQDDFLREIPSHVYEAYLLAATGMGMLWVGRYMIRGLRFLFSMVFEWAGRFAQTARRKLSYKGDGAPVGEMSFVK
jgi:hypothetical protein